MKIYVLNFWVFLAVWAFSGCGEQGLLSSWGTGFLLCQLLLLQSVGSQASVVAVHGLSCLATREIFLGQGSNPCPLHWQVDS